MTTTSTGTEPPIFRDELIALLERELVGPGAVDETIVDNPQKRYVCGQLAPLRDDDLEDEDQLAAESLAGANESDIDYESTPEPEPGTSSEETNADELDSGESNTISKARRDSLTSVGVSFSVESGQTVRYVATWGEYSRDATGAYTRTDHCAAGSVSIDEVRSLSSREHGRVSIRWVVRASADRMIASIFLGNHTQSTARDGTERLYQVRLQLSCDVSSAGFLPRVPLDSKISLDVNDLLFRDRQEFGVGLNIAVEPDFRRQRGCHTLVTRTLPFFETRTTKSNEINKDAKVLDMCWLADQLDKEETCSELAELFSHYRSWMENLRSSIDALPSRFRPLATAQVVRIQARVSRIENGIAILRRDPIAFDAFRFANEAMSRAQYRSDKKKSSDSDLTGKGRLGAWRPFQIAFLVSSLPDIVEPGRAQRDVVDVLFFPTGGGKTEAYLGLSAFAMAHRRLAKKASNSGAGVSTLMRYTLRLLTTQQFSRAATLICAAESIRRDKTFGTFLGHQPFSIGLWVGPMTPNNYSAAVEALKAARNEHRQCVRNCDLSRTQREFFSKPLRGREPANILPITECPWCNTPLCIECVDLDENTKRLLVRCSNARCPFSKKSSPPGIQIDGLPIFVVDEDVYRMTPTIVVATVDKFATLPFRGEAKSLFGRVSSFCEDCGFLTDSSEHRGHRDRTSKIAPNAVADLVIQDELHTINDNLGSIYGLYETAIDYLLTEGEIGPKYICATATVKDVAKQITALYGDRRAEIFPPTGFDAGDTFFSTDEIATAGERGRTYVGIYAPAFSRLSLFVAVLSAILATAWHLRMKFGNTSSDPYMTLLGYFNTVRDLGGVKALLGDDVPPVLLKIAQRNSWQPRDLVDWENELTGRIAASDVPDRLRVLDHEYRDGVGCDFMAATNMISVGVDVPRLGLMLVDGQPKSTSEYIQATSRVGRSHPGVVFVVYNSMRPRDVSHLEHFFSYHDAMYKFVEAGSITPFSDGAVDRYLRAALVACYRMRASHSDNESAKTFALDPDGILPTIVAAFEKRATQFGDHEANSANAAIEELLQSWRAAPPNIRYHSPITEWTGKNRRKPSTKISITSAVLKAADEPDSTEVESLFSAPRSMRNVEAEVPLRVHLDG